MSHDANPYTPPPTDPEVAMRDLAEAIHRHAGPTSTGRVAAIDIPMIGLEDVHFSASAPGCIAFRIGGGDVAEAMLDAEECQALSGFFAALAQLLGFRP